MSQLDLSRDNAQEKQGMSTVAKAKKKSWRQKLADSKGLPKTGEIDGRMSKRWGEGTMVIPAPLEVDAVMKRVRRGKLITIDAIRAALAKKHGTTIACPMTTGIFAWIAAHAADEAEQEGRARITPYWRTLKSGGELNPKYPGGIKNLRSRLSAEGHRIIKKGNRYFVAEFEAATTEPKVGVRRPSFRWT
jgi:hypothetical protein